METAAEFVITTLCGVIRDIYLEAENRLANEMHLRIFCDYLHNIEGILGKVDARTKQRMQVETLRQMEEMTRSVLDMLQKSAREKGFKSKLFDVISGTSSKIKEFIVETQGALQIKMQALLLDYNVSHNAVLSSALKQAPIRPSEQDVMEAWKVDAGSLKISQRMLGSGEFACTYEGTYNDQPVAVKIRHENFRKEIARDTSKIAKFNREVHNLFKVYHPNIVSIFGGIGLEGPPGKQLVIIMEHLDSTLLQEIQKSQPADSLLRRSRTERLRICYEACRGLAYLHSLNILHRDVHLKNVMLDANRVVKIINFGSSRIAIGGSAQASVVAAAPGWVAPEVSQGFAQKGFAEPTKMSDTFMMAMLCTAVCTCDPMERERPEQDCRVIAAKLSQVRIPPHAIHGISHGLAQEPSHRPTMMALATVLEAARQQLSKERKPQLPHQGSGRQLSPETPSAHDRSTPSEGSGSGVARGKARTPPPETPDSGGALLRRPSPDALPHTQRLPEGWTSGVDKQGRRFYFNQRKQCMQWEFPGSLDNAPGLAGVARQARAVPLRHEARSQPPAASPASGRVQGPPAMPGSGAMLGKLARGGAGSGRPVSGGAVPVPQVRGLCPACGEPVTTDQAREKLPSGQYRHTNGRCNAVSPSRGSPEASPAHSHSTDDKILATLSTYSFMWDGRPCDLRYIKSKDDVGKPVPGLKHKERPLHVLAYFNEEHLMKLLLFSLCSPHAVTNDYGATPLHLAAKNGSVAAMLLLLEAGTDKDTECTSQEGVVCTPLDYAVLFSKAEAAAALESHGARRKFCGKA